MTTTLDLADGYTALRSGVGAAPTSRDVVRVEGPDAVSYLQGQLSQDVDALAPGETTWSFVLQPQGKVDAWMRVHRAAADAVLLDVEAGTGAIIEARLRRFLLRTKAEITLDGAVPGLALRGPGAAATGRDLAARAEGLVAVLPAAWPGGDGIDVLARAVDPGEVPLAPAGALEAVRIEAGVPANGRELTEATIPAEAGAWVIDASVSFTKGCYTGQELVARIDSRGGNVPRPLRGIVLPGGAVPPAGASVAVAGEDVGEVTSAAASPPLGVVALAPVRRSVEPPATVTVTWGEGQVDGELRSLPLVG